LTGASNVKDPQATNRGGDSAVSSPDRDAANEQPALALVAELVQIAVPLGFRRLFLDQSDLLLAMVRQLAHDPKLLPFVQPLFLDDGLTTLHTPALSPLLPPHPCAIISSTLSQTWCGQSP